MTDDEIRQLASSCADQGEWVRAKVAAFFDRWPEHRNELGDDPDRRRRTAWLRAALARTELRLDSPAWQAWQAFSEPADEAWSAVCAEREEQQRRAVAEYRRRERVHALDAPLRPRDVEMLLRRELDESEPLAVVKAWARGLRDGSAPPFLILSGSAGVGKTLAACCWLTHAPAGQERGVYVRMRDLAESFTADYGEPSDAWRKAMRTPWLVVDEMSHERTERQLNRGRDVVFELLDRRGTGRHATILISNETVDGLIRRYGENDQRMAGRLRADALAVEFTGESLRPDWCAA